MTHDTQSLGRWGETAAQDYLISKGYKIIDRNFKNKIGEIDIIAKKGRLIAFVEVKTRDSIHAAHFLPEQSVTPHKQRKLRKLCEMYLTTHRLPEDQEWQIDVISIILDKTTKKARIKHIQNAVWG